MSGSLSRRPVVALLAGANLLLLAVGWFFLVAPQRHHAADLASSATAVESRIAAERARIAAESAPSVSAAPARAVIRTADLYQLAKAMPPSVDMPDLLLELDQVARAAGVTVQSIAPGGQTPGADAGIGVVPINLAFSGDFYAVSDMLFRLRSLVSVRRGALLASGRLFSVDSVSLAPAGSGRTLNATATVDAYVYDPASAAAAPGAAGATGTSSTATTTTSAGAAP